MKIYMLNAPFMPYFSRGMRWQARGRGRVLYYPIWLSYAAGILMKNKYDVRLVDAPAWKWSLDKVLKDAKQFNPDITVIDTSFPSLDNDLAVARRIKNETGCKVVIVGPPATVMHKDILKNNFVDACCRYEYDYTLLEYAGAINRNASPSKVKGLSYKVGKKIFVNRERVFIENLDELPFVSSVYKKFLNPKDYFLAESLYPMVQIMSSRGCPNMCTFCLWPQTLMGRKFRARSIVNVADELEYIRKNMNVKEVFIEDDTLTTDKKRTSGLCEEIVKRRLKISWSTNARADLSYSLIREMKNAGCRLLVVGYESAEQAILNNIKKGISTKQMLDFARNCKKAGMMVHACFVFGLPGETKDSIKKTIRFIRETRPETLQISVAFPFPGTEFYSWAESNGYITSNRYLDEKGYQQCILDYPQLSGREIEESIRNALKDYYLNTGYIPNLMRQVCRKHGFRELQRIFYSARMFMRYIKDG